MGSVPSQLFLGRHRRLQGPSPTRQLDSNSPHFLSIFQLLFGQHHPHSGEILLCHKVLRVQKSNILTLFIHLLKNGPNLASFCLFSFSHCMDKCSTEMTIMIKAQMACLGVEPGVAVWKAQTNPLSYGGIPFLFICFHDKQHQIKYIGTLKQESVNVVLSRDSNLELQDGRCRPIHLADQRSQKFNIMCYISYDEIAAIWKD